jgi:hypothetical protein
MLGKFMGVLDIFVSIAIILFQYNIIPGKIIFSLAFYLLIKTIIFFGDTLSMIDGLVAIYMMIMLLYQVEIISIICAVYLFIKGGLSMY